MSEDRRRETDGVEELDELLVENGKLDDGISSEKREKLTERGVLDGVIRELEEFLRETTLRRDQRWKGNLGCLSTAGSDNTLPELRRRRPLLSRLRTVILVSTTMRII